MYRGTHTLQWPSPGHPVPGLKFKFSLNVVMCPLKLKMVPYPWGPSSPAAAGQDGVTGETERHPAGCVATALSPLPLLTLSLGAGLPPACPAGVCTLRLQWAQSGLTSEAGCGRVNRPGWPRPVRQPDTSARTGPDGVGVGGGQGHVLLHPSTPRGQGGQGSLKQQICELQTPVPGAAQLSGEGGCSLGSCCQFPPLQPSSMHLGDVRHSRFL